MLQTKDAHKLKVYIKTKKGRVKKHGHVRNVIFHPSKPVAVGVTVKRPDFLWMIKRKDRFVTFDHLQRMEDGNLLAELEDKEAWDRNAFKRLGIDFDACIIWDNMDVRNLQGEPLGAISNIKLDDDLHITAIDVSKGSTERAILGAAEIPAECLKGYDPDAQAIVADIQKDDIEVAGGVAGKAGEAWATSKHRVQESQEDLSSRAAENIEQGAVAAGEAIGSLRDKVKESGASEKASELGAKAESAINDGAFKLGQAIGNLTRDDDAPAKSKKPVQAQAVEVKDAPADAPAETNTPKVVSEVTKKAAAAKKAADEDVDYDAAARKVGEQLRKTKGMFSAFKEEFDKASK